MLIRFNDRKILMAVLVVQVAVLSIVFFSTVGVGLPPVIAVFSFCYLTFVPGVLVLQILGVRICELSSILYAIGISLVFLAIVGLFISLGYPLIGILNPISPATLIATITAIIILLCLIVYNQKNTLRFSFEIKNFVSLDAWTLLMLLLPFLTIIGAYITHFYNNSVLLFLVLAIIASIPILVAFDKIPKKIFPLVAFVIFLSLLYHNSLSVPYLSGRDSQLEYYYANLVHLNSVWNPQAKAQINSLPCDVILPSIYSNVLRIDLTWISKLLYPFLFSLTSPIIYQVAKKQTDEKTAFFSCFFYSSLAINFEEILETPKQQVATFFTCLLVLLMVDSDLAPRKKAFLAIVFSVGLIFSHYGVPYVLLFSSFLVLFLLYVSKKLRDNGTKKCACLTTLPFVLFVGVFSLSWFMYTSANAGLSVIVWIGKTIVENIGELFSPVYRGGVYYIKTGLPGLEWEILRLLHYVTIFFISVGLLDAVLLKLRNKERVKRLHNEHLFYSVSFYLWLVASIVIPVIASGRTLGTARMYSLSLVFLALFGILGGAKTLRYAFSLFSKLKQKNLSESDGWKLLAVFFMIFFLFNSRFVMELRQEVWGHDAYVKSISLSQPRIREGRASLEELINFHVECQSELDVWGAKWLQQTKNVTKGIVIDVSPLVLTYAMISDPDVIEVRSIEMCLGFIGERYTFLREFNTRYDLMVGASTWWNASEIIELLEGESNKVYSNGGCIIYE